MPAHADTRCAAAAVAAPRVEGSSLIPNSALYKLGLEVYKLNGTNRDPRLRDLMQMKNLVLGVSRRFLCTVPESSPPTHSAS